MKRKQIDDIEYLKEAFQKDAESTMKNVYTSYRAEFLAFARSYNLQEDDVLDAYQETHIALYQNLIDGKINYSSSTVKTYLFSIGKHKLLNTIKKLKGKEEVAYNDNLITNYTEYISEERNETLVMSIKALGNSCREILTLFYYRKYSIEAIMQAMQMKNENTVKAAKSRCLKQLKGMMNKNVD